MESESIHRRFIENSSLPLKCEPRSLGNRRILDRRKDRRERVANEPWERKEIKITNAQAEAFDARLDLPDLILNGPCPRCKDGFNFRYQIIGLQGVKPIDNAAEERAALKTLVDDLQVDPQGTEADFTMFCRCGGDHDKRPADKEGCGAYWQFHAEWG